MKNKKGFTLVELLAVIVILALLITVAVPGTRSISKRLKNKMYCSKLDFIENAATLYGEDRRDSFDAHQRKNISVGELVKTNYLKKDQNSAPYIQDPRDKSKGLDNLSLTLYIKNNRVNVAFGNSIGNSCSKTLISDLGEIEPDPIEVPELTMSVNISKLKENQNLVIGTDNILAINMTNQEIEDSIQVSGGTIQVINGVTLETKTDANIIGKSYNIVKITTGISIDPVIISKYSPMIYTKDNDYSIGMSTYSIDEFRDNFEIQEGYIIVERTGMEYKTGPFVINDEIKIFSNSGELLKKITIIGGHI